MKHARSLSLPRALRRSSRALRRTAALLLLGFGLLAIWPYVNLWRLNEKVLSEPPSALSRLVDIDSVRAQILRRLNKDEQSNIGMVSDPFIEWIEQGMRTAGNETLRQSVSLAWLHGLLSGHIAGDRGFLPAVGYAFFDPPDGFLVRIDSLNQAPIYLRMELGLLGWRIGAVYY